MPPYRPKMDAVLSFKALELLVLDADDFMHSHGNGQTVLFNYYMAELRISMGCLRSQRLRILKAIMPSRMGNWPRVVPS